jgi:type III pantothenate kinase
VNVDVVVDAGNSFIKWGLCAGGKVKEIVLLAPAGPKGWESQIKSWELEEKCRWAVAGSDPARRDRIADWLRLVNQEVQVLTSHTQLPVAVNVKQPEKVGLDRLFNAVAVNARRPNGAAAVVIDAGTATTVDYVDEAGTFQGGAIMPGLGLMAELLYQGTAALPRLSREELLSQLPHESALPGKSTVEAMTLGMLACLRGGVERIVREYVKRAKSRVISYVGGGDCKILEADLAPGERQFWPEMTLEGIRITAERL